MKERQPFVRRIYNSYPLQSVYYVLNMPLLPHRASTAKKSRGFRSQKYCFLLYYRIRNAAEVPHTRRYSKYCSRMLQDLFPHPHICRSRHRFYVQHRELNFL